MASPFDRLMDTIRPHLPGAIEDAVRQELFLTCADFLKRSDVWQERIKFSVKLGDREGEIMPTAGRIERLLSVEEVNEGDGGRPRHIRGVFLGPLDLSNVAPIILPFEASEPSTFVAIVTLTVSDPTTRDAYPIIPSEIVGRYTEDLIHGILARMMSQPNKPYTNLSLAQFHNLKFRGGTSRAKNEAKTGYTAGSQVWTFPQTFNRRK